MIEISRKSWHGWVYMINNHNSVDDASMCDYVIIVLLRTLMIISMAAYVGWFFFCATFAVQTLVQAWMIPHSTWLSVFSSLFPVHLITMQQQMSYSFAVMILMLTVGVLGVGIITLGAVGVLWLEDYFTRYRYSPARSSFVSMVSNWRRKICVRVQIK